MKKEADTLKRFCLFLMNDMVVNHMLKDVSDEDANEIMEAHENFPINAVREYSKIRNKLQRLLKSFHVCHRMQLISHIANDFQIPEVINVLRKVWDAVGTPPHDPDFSIENIGKEFKMITIGRI